METLETVFSPILFYCNICMINCNRKSEWDRHIKTKKHIGNKMETNGNQNISTTLSCDCGRQYTNRSGLWKHKQKCKNDTNIQLTNLVLEVVKSNQDMQKQLEIH